MHIVPPQGQEEEGEAVVYAEDDDHENRFSQPADLRLIHGFSGVIRAGLQRYPQTHVHPRGV